MHRTIEIAAGAGASGALVAALERQEHVVGLHVHRGASVVPPGDLVVAHVLNRGADAVMRAVAEAEARSYFLPNSTSQGQVRLVCSQEVGRTQRMTEMGARS